MYCFQMFIKNKCHFGPFFPLQNSSIAWHLLNQTDLDRNFCECSVDLSCEGRFSTFLAHFSFCEHVAQP